MSENLKNLKEHFKEVSKEEILKLENGKAFIVYNPLTDLSTVETASSKDIVHNKYCYDKLRYFIKEKGFFKDE